MDETGPYLPPSCSDSKGKLLASPDVRVREEWEHRVLGPEKPSALKSRDPDNKLDRDSWKKAKTVDLVSSKKQHSKKHRPKEKSRNKKKEKKSKHRHKRS